MLKEYKAWYRGAFGIGPRQLVTVTGIGTNKGRIVLDCTTEDGRSHWGYLDQFEAVAVEDVE